MPFLNNLAKADTWNIVADFNHIKDPFGNPTQQQINHSNPIDISDRIGGCFLFALSVILVIPACCFLYWASKKVDIIESNNSQSSTGKINSTAQGTLKTSPLSSSNNLIQTHNILQKSDVVLQGSIDEALVEKILGKVNEDQKNQNKPQNTTTKLLLYRPEGRFQWDTVSNRRSTIHTNDVILVVCIPKNAKVAPASIKDPSISAQFNEIYTAHYWSNNFIGIVRHP